MWKNIIMFLALDMCICKIRKTYNHNKSIFILFGEGESPHFTVAPTLSLFFSPLLLSSLLFLCPQNPLLDLLSVVLISIKAFQGEASRLCRRQQPPQNLRIKDSGLNSENPQIWLQIQVWTNLWNCTLMGF